MKKVFYVSSLLLMSLFTAASCGGGGGGGGDKEKQYTVTFETYGGTPVPEKQIVSQTTSFRAFRPTDPGTITTEEGEQYTFNDWYVAPDSLEKFNFDNPISKDTTIYAHYDGGYQMIGKTNVDYNDFSDDNLVFKVQNKFGVDQEDFIYDLYFPDFIKEGEIFPIAIDAKTGRLSLYNTNQYMYGYVYAYRENSKKTGEYPYDFAYKKIHIATFNCLKFTKLGDTNNYEVSLNPDYTYELEPEFRVCIPEVYYVEGEGIKGNVTEVCTQDSSLKFGEFLSKRSSHGGSTVYIADSVEIIGVLAFGTKDYRSTVIEIFHISTNIKKIGNEAFRYCNGDAYKKLNTDFSKSKLESIGEYAFYNVYLKNYEFKFPATLRSIGKDAFYTYEANIPKSIEFADTNNWVRNDYTRDILDVSNITNNAKYLSKSTTSPGNWLNGIKKAVVYQDAFGFSRNSGTNTVKVISIDESKITEEFGEAPFKQYVASIPATVDYDGVTCTVNEIADNAFANKTKVNNIYLPDTIEKIGNSAFSGCTGLRAIHLPKSVSSIGENVFDNCYSLKSMSVDKDNDNFTSYMLDEFIYPAIYSKDYSILYYGCKSVASIDKELTMPKNLKEIKSHAFYGRYKEGVENTGIKGNITFSEGLIHIGADAFTNAFDMSSYKEDNYKIKFANVSNLWTFTKGSEILNGQRVNEPSLNIDHFEKYSSYDWKYRTEGSALEFDDTLSTKKATVKSYGTCTDTDVVIPTTHNGCTVTGVLHEAFKDKSNINTISIANTVTYLGPSSFENCTGLTELVIPKSVNQIGNAQFAGYDKRLVPIYVPWTGTFRGCSNLTKVYIEDYSTAWAYGTYKTVPSPTIPGAWSHEFVSKGTIQFSWNPEENAKLLTDYTSSETKTGYTWMKVGTF